MEIKKAQRMKAKPGQTAGAGENVQRPADGLRAGRQGRVDCWSMAQATCTRTWATMT